MGLFQRKKYGKIILYVLLFFIFFAGVQCSAELIFVDTENTDGPWVGSSDHPFQHIQDAIDAADDFDTIFIEPGLYEEQIIIEKPLNITGNITNRPRISGEKLSNQSMVTISDNDVHLDHIQVSNAYIGIYLENGSNNTLSNLTLFSNQIAVKVSNSSDENCFFSNNFVNNTFHVLVYTNNKWNTSKRGNYWDNYIGNDTNGDGIGNQSYIINSNENIDWLPLIEPVTKKPFVDFSFSPSIPSTANMITFTSLSHDGDGVITSWFWDFGDNNTSLAMNPNHQFQKSGTYNIAHTVMDNLGAINTTEKMVTVLNVPPSASFLFTPKNPTDIQQVMFEDGSTDSDGIIVNWTWDFGDNATSFEQNPAHQFSDDDTYFVRLTVKDDMEDTDSYAQSIMVRNVAPVASFTFTFSNVTALVDQPVYFQDSSVDPDGSIVSREWYFDDNSNSSEKNPTHTFSNKGSYTVSLSVIDDDGETASVTQQITVSDTIHHDEVITEFSLFDIVFVVFLVIMIILVIVLSKKYG